MWLHIIVGIFGKFKSDATMVKILQKHEIGSQKISELYIQT